MAEPNLVDSTALVIRLRETGESDLLVDVFTSRLGRITAIAKGARKSRKRFFGVLLAGHLLAARMAPGKSGDLWRLDEAKVLHNHAALRGHWLRWACAAPVLELLLRSTAPQDPCPGLLSLADNTLGRLCALDDHRQMATCLLGFMIHLARDLGFGPSLEHCAHCGRTADEHGACLLSPDGGLVCPDCRGGRARQVPPGLVKGLRTVLLLPPDKRDRFVFPFSVCRQGLEFMTEYMESVCGCQLQSLGVLLALLGQ